MKVLLPVVLAAVLAGIFRFGASRKHDVTGDYRRSPDAAG